MEETEQKIIKAAREEFIRVGLKGARMQDIADRAGVNKALLHYYFRTKDKLYEASIREIAETLWGTIGRDILSFGKVPDLQSYLRLFVTGYVKTMSENPLFIRLVIREIADGGTVIPKLVEKLISTLGTLPRGIIFAIEQEMKKGTIKKMDPIQIFLNLIGMCMITFIIQPVVESLAGQYDFKFAFDEEYYTKRIDCILETIFHGIMIKEPEK